MPFQLRAEGSKLCSGRQPADRVSCSWIFSMQRFDTAASFGRIASTKSHLRLIDSGNFLFWLWFFTGAGAALAGLIDENISLTDIDLSDNHLGGEQVRSMFCSDHHNENCSPLNRVPTGLGVRPHASTGVKGSRAFP